MAAMISQIEEQVIALVLRTLNHMEEGIRLLSVHLMGARLGDEALVRLVVGGVTLWVMRKGMDPRRIAKVINEMCDNEEGTA